MGVFEINIDVKISPDKILALRNYILKIMEERKIGFNQLKIKADLNSKTLTDLLYSDAKERINPFYLQKIAYALTIDYRELYKIVGYLDENLESNIRRIIPITEMETIEIPVYGRASAGNGYINLGEVTRVKTITLLNNERLSEGIFSVEVHGESMYPTFLEGDLVIVDPNCDTFKSNKVYVVTYNEETFIKRVIDHGKYIQLISDNPDKMKYKDIIISKKEEGASFKCNGKVMRLERDF